MCEGTTQMYDVTNDASATGYTWTMPAGWSGTSVTNSITATAGASGGMITVTADNACGSSPAQSIAVTVDPLPAMPSVIAGNDTVCGASSQTYSISPIAGATSYTWSIPGTWTGSSAIETITLNTDASSGTIMVHGSNACGNGPDEQLSITVQSAPSQPVLISADSIVCDGSMANISIVNDPQASSYTWTLPASWTGSSTTANMSAIAAGSGGVITVTENNSCGTSTSLVINAVVNPLPAVTVSSFGIVCDNDAPFALTGGAPAGGIYSGTGVTGGTTFDPSVSGAGMFNLTYVFTDANSCSNSASDSIQVDLCTGVAAAGNIDDVKVYPNPFSDQTVLYIGQSIELKGTEIRVFDMLGKEVMVISGIHSYQVTIERKDLRDGMYFYRLINDSKEISTGKLIIE